MDDVYMDEFPQVPTFEAFPKIPRFREMIVTEKIDGTNAAVVIEPFVARLHEGNDGLAVVKMNHSPADSFVVYAQSRKRLITPKTDNFGFAGWVHSNAHRLAAVLGPGRHFGEWWGKGIQRGYGLDHKAFSLFNTKRWSWLNNEHARLQWESDVRDQFGLEVAIPSNLHCVPTLYEGDFDTAHIRGVLLTLEMQGSVAAPGFLDPEGVVVYQPNANRLSKMTRNGDGGKFSK